MTKAERIAEMQVLREKAESLIMQYNEGIQNGNPSPTIEVNVLDSNGNVTGTKTEYITSLIEECVNKHTNNARELCFAECRETEDPMLEAIKRLEFTTIGLKVTKKGEEKIPVAEIVDKNKSIDVFKLHKTVNGGIGKDPKWNGLIEKMNYHMTVRQAKRLIGERGNLTKLLSEISDSYRLSDIAKQIDLGKDPTSNTKLLGTLQTIVTAMIGEEYKPTSHDVNYLIDIYAKKGRGALTVECSNHRYFRGYITDICHHIVTGDDYRLRSLEIKKNN